MDHYTTLTVDGWAVTFGTARSLSGCGPAQSPPCCTKCNSLPINGQCTIPTSRSIWHYKRLANKQ